MDKALPERALQVLLPFLQHEPRLTETARSVGPDLAKDNPD